MFESEIEQLKKHLAAKLPQPQPFVYLHDILVSAIDDCYKHSIQADVDWWIYEEQLERADHPHFDTTAPELQEMFAALDDAYRQYARFNNSQFNEAIESAVKVRLNFLCRPRTTLKWFVFRGAPTKTVYEIVLRLSYFSDYNYLTTGFHEWAQKTYSMHPSMDLLSVVEFEKIMETIDNDFILDLSPHQFVDMLIPLFEFFHLDKEFTPQLTIPTETLIVFLDDKGVELIAHEIERLLYNEDMEHISQERFLDIVTDIINQIEEQESLTASTENTDKAITGDVITDEHSTLETDSETEPEVHTAPENIAEEATESHSAEEVSEAQQNETEQEIVETVEEMMIETSKIQDEITPEIPDIAEDIINEEIKIHDEMTIESPPFEYPNSDYLNEVKNLEDDGRVVEHTIETTEKSVAISTENIEDYKTEKYETDEYDTTDYDTEEYGTEEYSTEEYDTDEYNSNDVLAIQEETSGEVVEYTENVVESPAEPVVVSTDAVQEISSQEVVIEDEILQEIQEGILVETFTIRDEISETSPDIEEILTENIEIQGETPVEIDTYYDGTPTEIFEVDQYHSTELHSESGEHYKQITPEIAEIQEEDTTRPLSVEIDITNEAIIFHDGVFNQAITAENRNEEFPAVKYDIPDVSNPEILKQATPSLQTYIDNKQREEFIKKLCAKDAQMFSQLVEDIDRCAAWREAAQVIDRFFIRHKIDHRSAPAISFRTIVQKRYSGM